MKLIKSFFFHQFISAVAVLLALCTAIVSGYLLGEEFEKHIRANEYSLSVTTTFVSTSNIELLVDNWVTIPYVQVLPLDATDYKTLTPLITPHSSHYILISPADQQIAVEWKVIETSSIYSAWGITTSSQVRIVDKLPLGTLMLHFPSTMYYGDSARVSLTIFPEDIDEELPTIVPTINPIHGEFTKEYEDKTPTYPRMSAELLCINFTMGTDGYVEKDINSSGPTSWTWTITPEKTGAQALTLNITTSYQTTSSGEIINPKLIKSIPFDIMVEENNPFSGSISATAIPPIDELTPSPSDSKVSKEVAKNLIDNSSAVLASILLFFGTILTLITSIQNSKRQAAINEIQQQITKENFEKKKLEEEISRLKSIKWWQFWRR